MSRPDRLVSRRGNGGWTPPGNPRSPTMNALFTFCVIYRIHRSVKFLKSLLVIGTTLIASFAHADENQLQVINHGVAALEKRFEMIDHAQNSIDVEYFIYNADEAGRLFSQALMRKHDQNPNVRIRVIIDSSLTVLALNPEYVAEFAKHGIELRYYNYTSIVSHFENAQHRDHRKLIVIDGKEAITGSRNIADEYFDLNETYNFRDRDVWVQGPIVKEMQASFENYWNDPLTVVPAPPAERKMRTHPELGKNAARLFVETKIDVSYRNSIRAIGTRVLADTRSRGTCDSLRYVTDRPGLPDSTDRPVLGNLMKRIDVMKKGEKLYVESPYFIVNDPGAIERMIFMEKSEISTVLLTNSLASTDAFYVAANFNDNISFYQTITDGKMYAYSGETPTNTPFIHRLNGQALTEKATWGIHSKTFVFGDRAFAIGTFNVDPRSAYLNSEMLLFCEGNRNLAKYVTDDIEARIGQSLFVRKDGLLSNGKRIEDGVDFKKKMEFRLSIKPSDWFARYL